MATNVLRLSTDLQSELLRVLTPQSDLTEMLTRIVDRAGRELRASACTIYAIDPGGRTATQRAGTGYQGRFANLARCDVVPASEVPENPSADEKLGLTGWILSTGKSFLAQSPQELTRHPHHSGRHDLEQMPGAALRLRSFLGVPLRGPHGRIIGMIKAERHEGLGDGARPFSVDDQIVLETAARVASRCLAYLEMAHASQAEAAVTAWTQDIIGEAAATEGELDSFLDIVVNATACAMRADSCAIFLVDESGKTLTQRAGIGSQALRYVIRAYPLPDPEQVKECRSAGACLPSSCATRPERDSHPGQPDPRCVGLTAWIAATGKSFHAHDMDELRTHCHHRGGFDPWNFPKGGTICGAWLGVPLRIGGTVIGVLKVENISTIGVPDPRDFSREAQQRFNILAEDIALAIKRLQAQSRARYQVISDAQLTIYEILHGGLGVPELVSKVVNETAKLFNARACALFLKEGDWLVQPQWAAYGWSGRGPAVRRYHLVPPEQVKDKPAPAEKVGLTVWIAVKQQKFVARSNLELTMHPHHLGTFDKDNFEANQRCESFIGVPLSVEGKLVGVLKVETKMRRIDPGVEEFTYFSEQDELVFDLIANSAAIALENAKLLESQRLAEQIRSQQRRLLFDLHNFVRSHWHATGTLSQAAALLQGEFPTIAQIITNYAALLQPEFPLQLLDALPGLIHDYREFLEGSHAAILLYQAFGKALRVESAEELDEARLRSWQSELADPRLLGHPFLAEPAEILIDLYGRVAASLQEGGPAGGEGSPEDQVRRHLAAARKAAEGLSQPEREIVCRIADHWLRTVGQPAFHRVINPYVPGKPIAPESSARFFGRRDIFEWVTENLHGGTQKNVFILYGESRMGKTSILLQLERGAMGKPLRERESWPLCPAYINLQRFADTGTHYLLRGIAKHIWNHPRVRGQVALPPIADFQAAPYQVFGDFLHEVSQLLGDSLLVLMLDEFEALQSRVESRKIDADIYQFLRDQMQFLPNVTFILTGMHRLEELSPDYRRLVLTVALHCEVGFMDDEDARALVVKPVEGLVTYEDRAVDELLRVTHCHPYLLQLLCHQLIYRMNRRAKSNLITLDDAHAAVAHFVGQGGTHLQYLWDWSTDGEKEVLSALAEAMAAGQPGAGSSDVAAGLSHPSPVIADALQKLLRRRLVEEADAAGAAGGKLYRHTIPLFCYWVHRHDPGRARGEEY